MAALIAGWAVASGSTVGEHVPERVAREIVEALPDGVEASVEFGRFCGFPCFIDLVPDGPDYGGHAVILVRGTDQPSVEAELMRLGLRSGRGGLVHNAPVPESADSEWHSSDVSDATGVVVFVRRLGSGEIGVTVVEAMPSGFRRWAAPVTAFGVLGAGAFGLGAIVARRRARLRRQVAASARSRL